MFRRGGACPSRQFPEFLRSTPGGSSCGSARRAVALYECHGPRRTGGSGDPPLRGVRRNTAKPDNGRDKPLPYGVVERDSPAEDRRAHGALCWGPPAAAIVGGSASPTRTLCHGWSKTGAAVEPYQPKFCTVSGPSGPGGMKPGIVFCAPEPLRKGVGVSPVNGGRGVARLWAGTPIGAHPRRRFASFAAAGKGGRPAGRNPVRRRDLRTSRPTGGRAATWGRPYNVSGGSQQDGKTGGASPSPTRCRGNIPRQRTGGRVWDPPLLYYIG